MAQSVSAGRSAVAIVPLPVAIGHTYPLLSLSRAVRFTYIPINGLTGRLLFSRVIVCCFVPL